MAYTIKRGCVALARVSSRRRVDRRTVLDVARGSTVQIVDVSANRQLAHRLTSLGLVPGALVTVHRPFGPALVSVNGTRVAIDRTAAAALIVDEAER